MLLYNKINYYGKRAILARFAVWKEKIHRGGIIKILHAYTTRKTRYRANRATDIIIVSKRRRLYTARRTLVCLYVSCTYIITCIRIYNNICKRCVCV